MHNMFPAFSTTDYLTWGISIAESHISIGVISMWKKTWISNVKCFNVICRTLSTRPARHYVTMTNRDKSWVTPLVKHLINEKWSAFRCRNWVVYHHLKQKLRREIHKAKTSWVGKTKASSRNLWSFVNSILNKKTNNSIDTLLRNFSSMEEVFEELKNVLLPNSTGKSEVNPNYGFSSNGWNPVILREKSMVN